MLAHYRLCEGQIEKRLPSVLFTLGQVWATVQRRAGA